MKKSRFTLFFILVVIAQIFANNELFFGHYLHFDLLPMLILCVPVNTGRAKLILIAFLTGLAVDFFSIYPLGMTSAALMVAAFLRDFFINLFCGEEILMQKDKTVPSVAPVPAFVLCLTMVLLVYLALFCWIEGAGMRTGGFIVLKTFLSTILDAATGLVVGMKLFTEKR